MNSQDMINPTGQSIHYMVLIIKSTGQQLINISHNL
jgi:hypothetical protein